MKNKIDQYTDTDDEKLFALIEQGDEGAFTQAYERIICISLSLFNEF